MVFLPVNVGKSRLLYNNRDNMEIDKLTIGIDIDGVIVDYVNMILPLLSEVCNRPVSYQDLSCWDIGEALDITEETVEYIWQQVFDSDMLLNAKPIKGAIDSMSALARHDIWIITSRPPAMQEITVSWLDNWSVRYDHIVFENEKHAISSRNNINIFIEDSLEQACAIAEAGINALLYDQPWNQVETLPEKCTRIYDWPSILHFIDRYEKSGEK